MLNFYGLPGYTWNIVGLPGYTWNIVESGVKHH